MHDISVMILTLHSSGVEARDMPYEVEVAIPVENYDPVQFTLAKTCGIYYRNIICACFMNVAY